MTTPQLVLEYLKVLLSTQVVAGIVSLAILWIFRDDLKALLLRIAKIRLPGGTDFPHLKLPDWNTHPKTNHPQSFPSKIQPL